MPVMKMLMNGSGVKMKSSSNGAGAGSASSSSSSSSAAMSYFAAAAAGYGAADQYAAAFGAAGFSPSAAVPTANSSFIGSQQVPVCASVLCVLPCFYAAIAIFPRMKLIIIWAAG